MSLFVGPDVQASLLLMVKQHSHHVPHPHSQQYTQAAGEEIALPQFLYLKNKKLVTWNMQYFRTDWEETYLRGCYSS